MQEQCPFDPPMNIINCCCEPRCMCCCIQGPTGATGATGVTGPTGAAANAVECFCVAQMRNVLQQIITLYPDDNLVVSMESGNNAAGGPPPCCRRRTPIQMPVCFSWPITRASPRRLCLSAGSPPSALPARPTTMPSPTFPPRYRHPRAAVPTARTPYSLIFRQEPPVWTSTPAGKPSHRAPCCRVSSVCWFWSGQTTATPPLCPPAKRKLSTNSRRHYRNGAAGTQKTAGNSFRIARRLSGCGTRIRTLTNSVRDCRATITQFRKI